MRPDEIVTPSGVIKDGALLVDGDRIVAVGPASQVPRPSEAEVVEAQGFILAPGFIDLQINGAFGHAFTASPATIWEVAAHLPRYGVTSFLPTVITSPL